MSKVLVLKGIRNTKHLFWIPPDIRVKSAKITCLQPLLVSLCSIPKGSRSEPCLYLRVFPKRSTYSLVPKESNVTLVPHITLIRPNTAPLKSAITLFWVHTKRKTVMTLIRIVLLSNSCACALCSHYSC